MVSPAVTIKAFEAMTLTELHACLKLRGEVFVVEQGICVEPDVDADDPRCHHAMLWVGDTLAGTARLLPIDGGARVKLGRLAVGLAFRRRGFGEAVIHASQAWIAQQPGRVGVMSAQAYLEKWYASLGWQTVGEGYLEAGIDHVWMVWSPPGTGL